MGQILLYVNSIACATYVILSTGLELPIRDVHGNPVDLVRYLEWIFTCPSLILMIGTITESPKARVQKIVTADVTMVLLGFVSNFDFPGSIAFSALSSLLFCFVIYEIDHMFSTALDPDADSLLESSTIWRVRIFTWLGWSGFPIIFFISRAKVLPFQYTEILYSASDICIQKLK
jgi:bacteriorhodopsin